MQGSVFIAASSICNCMPCRPTEAPVQMLTHSKAQFHNVSAVRVNEREYHLWLVHFVFFFCVFLFRGEMNWNQINVFVCLFISVRKMKKRAN